LDTHNRPPLLKLDLDTKFLSQRRFVFSLGMTQGFKSELLQHFQRLHSQDEFVPPASWSIIAGNSREGDFIADEQSKHSSLSCVVTPIS
jgi:hypothetical protein